MNVGRQPVAAYAASVLAVAILAVGCASPDTRPTLASADEGSVAGASSENSESAVQIEVLDGEDIAKPEPAQDQAAGEHGDAGAEQRDGSQPRYSVVAQAITSSVTARSDPTVDAAAIADFSNPTESGSPLVFRAVPGGITSGDWIEVQLPVQPNGTTGWVSRDAVTLSDNPYRVEISRADYSLRVFHLNDLWVETAIAVGNGETPTPVGEFYLIELLQPSDPTGPYGPYAFGLSGFSEVLTSFGGADEAIIGLHGTNDPSSLGTDVSHGCIRLENDLIEQFATVLPLGTPVVIT